MDQADLDPTLLALCPGYEMEVWRDEDLARDLFDRHLASFSLPYTALQDMSEQTAASLLRRAARAVYATDKYSKRGEFGELFLHAICRDVYRSEPAISKITFKDSANDTVKGFDSVHVVEIDDELELWLGEVKFYSNLSYAIRDVTAELADHLDAGYLRGEFVAVVNKLDPAWPHAEKIERLLHENTSLDDVFNVLTIPVLLTYDSPTVAGFTSVSDEYVAALTGEAAAAWEKFAGKLDSSWTVRIRLILMPLYSKERLLDRLQERLISWQHL